MNRSFENIFEKYNIKCERPRKRTRSPKKQIINFRKKNLPIMTKGSAVISTSCGFSNLNRTLTSTNSPCVFNKKTKSKYNTPTRYSTLDVIEVHRNKGNLLCYDSKENIPETKNLSETREYGLKAGGGCDNILDASMQYDETHDFTEHDACTSKSNFPASSFTEETQTVINQSMNSESTELDLLIDLIEQQNAALEGGAKVKQAKRLVNYNDAFLVSKSRIKDGLQELFEGALKREKAKNSFLEYDKKIGLRIGEILTVENLETSNGLTVAIVQSGNFNQKFAVVVKREMMPHIKTGSQIETFFDEKTLPYKLLFNGEYLDVYLEPYKILISNQK